MSLVIPMPWSDNPAREPLPVPVELVSLWQDATLLFESVDEPPADIGPDWGEAGARTLKLRLSRDTPGGDVILIIGDDAGDQDRFVRAGSAFWILLTAAETLLTPGTYFLEVRSTAIDGWPSADNHVICRRYLTILNSPFAGAFTPPPAVAVPLDRGGTGANLAAAAAGVLFKPLAGSTAIVTLPLGPSMNAAGGTLNASGGGGGGSVDSVNGQTGVVVLGAADVGAAAAGHTHAQSDVTGLVAALALKAPLASPALTGTPTAPTAINATSSTQIATTAFVHALITDLLGTAPAALDTLGELAGALADDANFAATVTTALAGKASTAALAAHEAATTNIHGIADTSLLVTTTGTQTLTGKTLTTPTIGSFANAAHTHQDAAGGGTLNASAIAAGTVATARLGSGTADATKFLRGDSTWDTPAGGSMAIGGTVTGGTAGRILLVGAGPVLADSASLTFDPNYPTTLRMLFGGDLQFRYDANINAGMRHVMGTRSLELFAGRDASEGSGGDILLTTASNLAGPPGVIVASGAVELVQVASGGTPATNTGRIYTKDVSGTAEIFVKDEAGNETQISPHAMDGPATFYDGEPMVPHVIKESNHYLGGVRYANISRACQLLEDFFKAIKQGRTFAQIQATIQAKTPAQLDLFFQESFAQHNARLGLTGDRALTTLSWAAEQAKQQATYDAARVADQSMHDAWQKVKDEYLARKAAWDAADPGTRGAAPIEPGPEPAVRPNRDIRKAVPPWLAARGVT